MAAINAMVEERTVGEDDLLTLGRQLSEGGDDRRMHTRTHQQGIPDPPVQRMPLLNA